MTPEEKYLSWKRTNNAVACRFARLLAMNPKGYDQRVERVGGASAPRLATRVNQLVAKHVAAPNAVALTLVFPGLNDLATLVGTALALGSKPGWTVKPWHEPATPAGPVVAFGMA